MTVNVFIHQLQAVVMAIFFKFNMVINIFGVHIAIPMSKNTFLLFVIFFNKCRVKNHNGQARQACGCQIGWFSAKHQSLLLGFCLKRTPLTNARMSVNVDISLKLSIRYFTLISNRYIGKDIDMH